MSTPYPLTVRDAITGQTLYLNPYRGTYTPSRSYALRMQRGYSRGISQQQARRNITGQGLPEHVVREQRFQERYGVSQAEWARMRRQYPDLDAVNKQTGVTGPRAGFDDPRIWPDMIKEAEQKIAAGQLEPDWINIRLHNRLYDMKQYENGNPLPGRLDFDSRDYYMPYEWWFYH